MEGSQGPERAMLIVKHLLLCSIYAAVLVWALWWLVYFEAPKHYKATKYLDRIQKHIACRFFRTDDHYGSVIIYQVIPFIVAAIFSFAVVELRKRLQYETPSTSNTKAACIKMTTYPIVVRSPLGVLTVAELLFIMGIFTLVSYSFARTTYLRSQELHLRYALKPATFDASFFKMQMEYPWQ